MAYIIHNGTFKGKSRERIASFKMEADGFGGRAWASGKQRLTHTGKNDSSAVGGPAVPRSSASSKREISGVTANEPDSPIVSPGEGQGRQKHELRPRMNGVMLSGALEGRRFPHFWQAKPVRSEADFLLSVLENPFLSLGERRLYPHFWIAESSPQRSRLSAVRPQKRIST